MKARFENKVALITGASDRGIGGAIAERLAEEGAAVALLSRSEPRRLLKRLERMQARTAWNACDITEADDVGRAVAAIGERFERLDVVINNAGIEIAAPFATFSEEDWQRTIDINLTGAARVTRAALPCFPEGRGAIVSVASALALGGCPSFAAYSASKAGLVGWTQSLAWELAPHIRVNCVAPGLVHTPMIHKHVAHLNDATRRQIEHAHPLGMGMPHDVAAAAAFLASDDARWITGATLPVGWAPHYPLPVDHFMSP